MPTHPCTWAHTCMCSHTCVDMDTHMHISHTKMGKERIHVLYGFPCSSLHVFILEALSRSFSLETAICSSFYLQMGYSPSRSIMASYAHPAFPVDRPLYDSTWDPSSEASSPSNPYALLLCHAKVLRNKRLVCSFC